MPTIKPKAATTTAATKKTKVVKPKTIHKPNKLGQTGGLIDENQQRRAAFLTDAQTRWTALEWEQFISEYTYTPSDELTKEERNQLNYGRCFMRTERELRKLRSIEVAKELSTSAGKKSFDKDVTVTQNFQQADDLEAKVKALADKKNMDVIQGTVPLPAKHLPFITIDIDEKEKSNAEMFEANPMEKMWQTAEQLARQGNKDSWSSLGFQMQAMVNHCFESLRETGEVIYPKELKDLFWPHLKIMDMAPESVQRRGAMKARVQAYLQKKKENPHPGFDLESKSYRVTLAAVNLANAIERYAVNWKDDGITKQEDDNILGKIVQQRAFEYYLAHLPIPKEDIKPGPISNIDPDLMTYLKTVKEYDLVEGQLLHQVLL